jgi:D-alanyl-D-alanine carboxypeptidase (penicillin-binding protein 5/6)
MKFTRFFCLLLTICLAFSGIPAVQADNATPVNSCYGVDATSPLDESGKLADTAKAVIIYELTSDTMVYAYNTDNTIYPASMVKIMTALVALEQGDLNELVTVSRAAVNSIKPGSVSANLKAGEQMRLQDLLYCLMVPSANDAAAVIAEHIAGSQEDFVALMNQRAQELGCTGTHYSNVHGLHDDGTYTTARDICRLMDYALENGTLKEMFETKVYTIPATNKASERTIHTTNYMMSTEQVKKYYDERVTGGKTGHTDKAGRCLTATAKVGNMELLTIVMGAKATYEEDGLSLIRFGSFEETSQLLDHIAAKYTLRQLFSQGQPIAQADVVNGAHDASIGPLDTLFAVLPKDTADSDLRWDYDAATLTAPIAQNQTVSSLQVWYGNKCIAQTDLVSINAVPIYAAPIIPEITLPKEDDSGSWTTLIIIVGTVITLFVLYFLALILRRSIQNAIQRKRRRRRRMSRRRSR